MSLALVHFSSRPSAIYTTKALHSPQHQSTFTSRVSNSCWWKACGQPCGPDWAHKHVPSYMLDPTHAMLAPAGLGLYCTQCPGGDSPKYIAPDSANPWHLLHEVPAPEQPGGSTRTMDPGAAVENAACCACPRSTREGPGLARAAATFDTHHEPCKWGQSRWAMRACRLTLNPGANLEQMSDLSLMPLVYIIPHGPLYMHQSYNEFCVSYVAMLTVTSTVAKLKYEVTNKKFNIWLQSGDLPRGLSALLRSQIM